MFKTFLTFSLLAATVAVTAQAQTNSCQNRSVPAPVVVDVAWERMSRFQNRYEDFYARCGSMIGQLKHAEIQARRFLNTGNLGQAANILINTLISSSHDLPAEDADVSYPLTIESIRQGARIAQTLLTATQTDRGLTPRMASQVKYNVIAKVYKAIDQAYNELDANYYLQVNQRCYGGCVSVGLPEVYDGYYNGVADLAKIFLNIQRNSAAAQGTDRVELNLTAAAAKAARKIIMNSVFRRDYSCAIMELHTIQVEAEAYLCQGNPGYNQWSFVEELRSRLSSVNFPARGCGHGGWRPRHHNGWNGGYGGQVGIGGRY